MSQDYLRFKCISNMPEDYQSKFQDIVTLYRPKLNMILFRGGSIYTMHDFEHHCMDLYKIISDYILNSNIAYSETVGALTPRELFILNLAVLLHDVGMTKNIDFNRDNHSLKSGEIIREDYRNPANPLTETRSGLTINEIDELALIVQAHSDVKDGSIKSCENGLKNPELHNDMPAKIGRIRAKLLADILRMADELDVTTDRVSAFDIECELEKAADEYEHIQSQQKTESDEEARKKLQAMLDERKGAVESLKHWKKLYYFKDIKVREDGQAFIVIDDKQVKREVDGGANYDEIADIIYEVYEKLYKEFVDFSSDVNQNLAWSNLISLKGVNLQTQNSELRRAIEEIKNNRQSRVIEARKLPKLISGDVAQKIKQFVEERDLFEVGHFYLSDEECARDWVNVDEIIETEKIFTECQTQLLLHIQSLMKGRADKYLIVGVDFGGMIIASRLSYILQKPYTYVIPSNKVRMSSVKEINSFADGFEEIILITDVIVSYRQIKRIIADNGLEGKICAIYAVLFRDTESHEFIRNNSNESLIEMTYVLNNDFAIELQKNDKCPYKHNALCKSHYKTYD